MNKKILSLFFYLSVLISCQYHPIKPWDHHLLSQKIMQFDGYSIENYFDEHIYYSKESSSGGQGIGGGGCGCN